MSAPNTPHLVKIARKRGAEEAPNPDTLIVQSHDGDKTATKTVYVRRQQEKRQHVRSDSAAKNTAQEGEAKFARKGPHNELARRLFRLQAPSRPEKRKRGEQEVATFVEQRVDKGAKSVKSGATDNEDKAEDVEQYAAGAPERPLKRPSRQPRAKRTEVGGARVQTEEQRRELESLANYLHEASIDEIKREARPVAKISPKISGQRAKELHRQRVESNKALSRNEDADTSDGDYVYDTYVRATSPAFDTDFDSRAEEAQDVGYLVIAPEDQDRWEAYFDDKAASDAEQASDDEDENAEDYYGADYPEDELSEDDEFDRGVYSYRRRGDESDAEADEDGYDSDALSDDDAEMERMMNPFQYRGPRLGGVQRRLAEGGGEGS